MGLNLRSVRIDALDRFKDFEIQNKVFQHCDAGAYQSLFDRKDILKTKRDDYPETDGTSSSSGSRKSRASALPSIALSSPSNYFDRAQSVLLTGQRYIDGGLVLPTETTMDLVTSFTVEASQWAHLNHLGTSVEKNKGSRRSNPSNTGRLLVQLVRDSRLYELSFRALNRVCELDRRFADLTTVKEGNRQHLEYYWETLQRLLQNVCLFVACRCRF